MKIIVSLFLGLSFTSCAQLQKLSAEGKERRVYTTHAVWVRQTTVKDNLAFRKINRMKPLLFMDLVIQGNAIDGMVAYDKSSGQEKWRLPVLNGVEAPATLINDRLFFGGLDGQFYSVQASTGQILWTFPTRIETLSEPLLQEGVIYFLTGNNSLYALDASNGKQLWLYTRQDTSSLSIRGGSKPAYRNGTIYAGFSDGTLVALASNNGAVKWEKQLNRNKRFKDLDSQPVIEGDFLYITGYDDSIHCLRAATGENVWKFDRGGYGQILVQGDNLFYASSNSEMIALNKETGSKLWSFPLKEGIPTSPSLLKGVLVFGESQGKLRFLDPLSGKQISSFDSGKGILSQPMTDEKSNSVYFISNEANLYRLEARWQ